MEHEYANVNGIRMHYVRAGKGPLIVFLHGFPEFWYEWRNQLTEFGRDHLAVAPDMRGYNLTSKPEALDEYQMPKLIEDVAALARHLKHDKFTLVGHDWGGAVAWSFAMAHPEMLDKLVIINAPHPGIFARLLASDAAQQKASEYMLLFRSPQAEQRLSENNCAMLVNIVLSDGLKRGFFTAADTTAYIQAWSQPGALTGGLNYYRAMRVGLNTDLTVKVPTLVIWGERDTALLPSNLDGLDRFVPQLTIKRIPDATHWVIHERPAEVNAYIREFLSAADAGMWHLETHHL